MLKLFVWSRHPFDCETKALALLDRLAAGPLAPTTFGAFQPVRSKLTAAGRLTAAAMLSGAPGHRSGSLFLSAKKPPSTLLFEWAGGSINQWYGEFDDQLLDTPAARDALVGFLADCFREFPIVFAGVAHEDDWQSKHWIIEKFDDGGETHIKVGLGVEGCLPGIYWLTAFGPELTAHFGRDALLALPSREAIDLGDRGVAIVLDADPRDADRTTMGEREAAVVRALGQNYIFDIADTARACTPIAGATDPNSRQFRPRA